MQDNNVNLYTSIYIIYFYVTQLLYVVILYFNI